MKTIKFGNIEIEYDSTNTQKFYAKQYPFGCDCPDCLDYVNKLPTVKNLIKRFDVKLGIDITKDVGQGMDELVPINYDDHNLYVIPYYIDGECKVNNIALTKEQNGPVMNSTIKAEHKIDDNLTLTIINTTDSIKFKNAKSVLTIWFEFKTPLFKQNLPQEKEKKREVITVNVDEEIDKAVKTTLWNKIRRYLNK